MSKKNIFDLLGLAIGLTELVVSFMSARTNEQEMIEEVKKKVLEELDSRSKR